jgi:hypothetical protein
VASSARENLDGQTWTVGEDEGENNPDEENNPGDLDDEGWLIGSVIQLGHVPVRGHTLKAGTSGIRGRTAGRASPATGSGVPVASRSEVNQP